MHVLGILVHGQENDFRTGAGRAKLPGRFDAIQHWHGDVKYQDIWFKTGSFFQQCLPVGHRLDHLELRLEKSRGSREEVLMVIRQEYANPNQVFFLRSVGTGEQTRNHGPS